MSLISLDASKCVRSLSKGSECNSCETVCPTTAIVIKENILPSINFSACVGCGACDAVCPNEALTLDDFSSINFFFEFLEDDGNLISCRKNVPCIAALSVENIISTAIFKKEVILDTGYCAECDIASTCHAQIVKNYEEASYVLEAMQSSSVIKLEDVKYSDEKEPKSDRRDFLRSINLKTVAKTKHTFEQEMKKAGDELVEHSLQKADIALLKQKRIPEKRKLLFTSLKRVEKPSQYHVIDANELSFTSQKLLNEDVCTACQMCYRLCPSGALSSDGKNSKIEFDPFLCIKCNVCHDVCEPNALTLSSSYNMRELFEPKAHNLIHFSVRRCGECNSVFSTNSADELCHRCKIEDEEARALWGITDDM